MFPMLLSFYDQRVTETIHPGAKIGTLIELLIFIESTQLQVIATSGNSLETYCKAVLDCRQILSFF